MLTRRGMLAGSALMLSSTALFAKEQDPLPFGLSDEIHHLMKANDVPGLGFGYVKHGRLACIAGFGYANRETQRKVTVDTVFHLASVTKVVTGTVLMQLWEAGRFTSMIRSSVTSISRSSTPATRRRSHFASSSRTLLRSGIVTTLDFRCRAIPR